MVTQTLEIEVSANTKQLKSDLNQVRDDLTGFQRRIKSQEAINLSINVAKIKTQLDEARAELKLFQAAGNREGEIIVTAQIERLKQNLTGARRELRNFVRTGESDVSVLGKLFNGLGTSVKGVTTQLLSAGAAFIGFNQAASFIGDAVQASLQFETAFTKVAKTVDGTAEELANLRKELEQLSTEIPVSFTELASIAEIAGQLGVRTADIISFTETVAGIATATNLSAEQAATDFARLANILNEPIENVETLASVVIQLGNNFAAQESEILNFTSRIAGAGNVAGFTSESLFAIATAFTALGVGAEAGGTAVSKSFAAIDEAVSETGRELEILATLAGQSSEEFAELWESNAAEAFNRFVQGLNDDGIDARNVIKDLIGEDARLVDAFLRASEAGDLFTETLASANEEVEKGTALQNEVNDAYGTSEARLKSIRGEIEENAAALGDSLVPAYIALLEAQSLFISFGTRVVNAFNLTKNAIDSTLESAAEATVGFVKLSSTRIGDFLQDSFGSDTQQQINKTTSSLETFSKLVDSTKSRAISFGDNIKDSFQKVVSFANDASNNLQDFEESVSDVNVDTDKLNGLLEDTTEETKATAAALREQKSELNDLISLTKARFDLEDKKIEATGERQVEIQNLLLNNARLRVEELEKIGAGEEDILQAQEKVLSITQKLNSEVQKEFEAFEKEGEKAFDAVVDGTIDSVESLEKFGEEIGNISDDFKDLEKEISRSIDNINAEITGVDQSELESLGDRRVELLENEAELQEKLNDLRGEGISLSTAERVGADTLSTLPESAFVGTDTVGDLREILAVQKELIDVQKELGIINDNLTAEEIKNIEELSKLTESERIIKEAELERQRLEERKKILEQIKNNEEINLQEIADLENRQLAEDLIAKKENLEQQLELAQENFNKELEALENLDAERRLVEENYTNFLKEQFNIRKEDAESLIDTLSSLENIAAGLGLSASQLGSQDAQSSVVNNNQRDINIVNNVSSGVDVESINRSFSSI